MRWISATALGGCVILCLWMLCDRGSERRAVLSSPQLRPSATGIHIKGLAEEEKELKLKRMHALHPGAGALHDFEHSLEARSGKRHARQPSSWRMRHIQAALKRLQAKGRDEEARMASMRREIAQDRKDYHEARELLRRGIKDRKLAESERERAEKMIKEAKKEKEELEQKKLTDDRLRREVKDRVQSLRIAQDDDVQEQKHNQIVMDTIYSIQQQANAERSEAMTLRSDALNSLAEARRYAREAKNMRGLARSMQNTAKLDGQAASISQNAEASSGSKVRGGGDLSLSEKVKETVSRLRKEAARYRHEASQLMIKSEMVASKAPRDLAVANKVLKTANALYQHAQRVQTSLRSAEILHQQTEYQQMPQRQQELVSKEAAVERLAANLKGEEQVADHLQELVKRRRGGGGGLTCRQQIEAKELFHKAAADVRSSNQEAREAKISLKAARTSEIEDEGRLQAMQRAWRFSQQQMASLNGSGHR